MTLTEFNHLTTDQRKAELRKCCGAEAWTEGMCLCFPFASKETLLAKADEIWNGLTESDWLQAFAHHPKIGDLESLKKKFASTAGFAANEQASVRQASPQTLEALAKGNDEYEHKFSYIFIVCATGKSAEEMLDMLISRLPNSKEEEIRLAAGEQAKITKLRLEKLLS